MPSTPNGDGEVSPEFLQQGKQTWPCLQSIFLRNGAWRDPNNRIFGTGPLTMQCVECTGRKRSQPDWKSMTSCLRHYTAQGE